MSADRKPEAPAAPPAPDEAQALMLAFQRGDDAAFDRLVVLTKNDVAALAHRYGLDAMTTDDLAQETFIRVYRSRASYKPEARFRAWLLRIATNLVISEARGKKRARVVPLEVRGDASEEGEAARADPRAEAPSARAEQAELERAVEAAVRELPETQRAAIVLNRFHDQSYEEVAAALSLTVEAVKSLLFRARQNLKTALGRYVREAESAGENSTETSPRGKR
jgi:RNA polymerase sigma-70 factor (ECF subfamily)